MPETSNFQDTFGAMLIGALVTMAVYGITTLQAYFYFLSFPKDGQATKLLVALIWTLDTIHVIFMCHSVHFYLIDGFTNRLLLVNGNWSLFISIATNVVIAFIVQAFFAQRIFLLCSGQKRYWIAGVISAFVFSHFVFGIITVVNLFMKKRFSQLHEVSLGSVIPFGATTIISDIMIAAALCILLHNKRSSFADTNLIINKLIIFAVNRCLLTCAMAIVETIVFSVLPNSFYSIAIDFVIGKLYANSLLAVLNARADLNPNARGDDQSSTELSTSFNIRSANHHTSVIRVRSQESSRHNQDHSIEKGVTHTITPSPSGSKPFRPSVISTTDSDTKS